MRKRPELSITDALLTPNEWSRPGRKNAPPRAVVLHWTADPAASAMQIRDYFESLKDGRGVYASAHYIVGQNGEIVRAVPEEEIAYHCGTSQRDPKSGRVYTDKARELFGCYAEDFRRCSPNLCSIGVELCPLDETGAFSSLTLSRAARLCAEICLRFGLDADRLTTHHEVVGWKDCPRLWTREPHLFEDFKDSVYNLTHGGKA